MSHKVYSLSVRDHLAEAVKRFLAADGAYKNLSDKTTPYAAALKALGELHLQVAQIWMDAPLEVTP